VNVGLSVSRVGSAAQIQAMKQVAGSVKLELAQYREMEAFSQFGSELDESTQRLIHRGARLTELLKQPQYAPFRIEQQVVSMYLGVKGYVDKIPVAQLKAFEHKMHDVLRLNHQELMNDIAERKQITEETEVKLKIFLECFVRDFIAVV
jgi:F-type H+-transporting ATPase subunit alpha